MAYISLYRKWRSQNFDELVGQDHITITLRNAIKNEMISHAYLFCGPRGTGKTSLARIFAKTLNCREGTDAEPCNECSICRRITEGTSLDVIEIDAASHTGVEKVREFIINKVDFYPAEGKYKIYIIDEVHKFSTSSFNALLKTLEEPPPHVIFILATTHPQALLPTILSRCQRYDFRRIPTRLIEDRLRLVAEKEGFIIEEEALKTIAERADGSLRDALVILEQVAAMSEREISITDVITLLGITESSVLMEMEEIFARKDTLEGLKLINEMVERGKDLEQLASDLIEYYRRLILLKVSEETASLLFLSEEKASAMKVRAGEYESGELMRIIKYLQELKEELRGSNHRRLLWEMAVIRLTRWQEDPSIESIRQGLLEIERKLKKSESHPHEEVEVQKEIKKVNGNIKNLWNTLLQAVKKDKMYLYTILNNARLMESGSGEMTLGFKYKFHLEKAEKEKAYLERKAMELSLSPVSILFRLLGREDGIQDDIEEIQKDRVHQEFVEEAQDLFGGGKILEKGR